MSQHLRQAPSADQIALKALSTRRRQITELIAMEKTRLGQAVEDGIVASHKAVIRALTAACTEVEGELARRITADRALARKREILSSVPGIGARIAALLITDMPELGTLDRKGRGELGRSRTPPWPERRRRWAALNPIGVLHGRHGGGPLGDVL